MIGWTPYHRIPDGSVLVSHHFTWALVLACIPLLVVWDDHPKREPWLAFSAVVVGLLAFLIVWRTHPVLGSLLAVTANLTAVGVLAIRLAQSLRAESPLWPPLPLAVAFVLALVALDDVVQHAFGTTTPLDWLWKHWLRPRLPSH